MSIVAAIKGKSGKSGFGYGSTAEEVTDGLDLFGRTMLVTGVNSGLGLETARVLAARGARIFGAARTVEKAREVTGKLGNGSLPFACELSDPASVRACVAAVLDTGSRLDAVICNAGIMALPERTIHHGHELQFFTNHVGHFMLVTGVLPALTDRGRVVMLSSGAHNWAPPAGIQFDDLSFEGGYAGNRAYGQSKLANLLFARALARRFAGTSKTANAVHPGVIATNLTRHMNPMVRLLVPVASALAMKSIPQGAATQCWAATHPSLETVNGEYFADCNVAKSSRHARDEAMGERLWTVTEAIVAGLPA